MKKILLIFAGFVLSGTLGMSLNAVAYEREYPILDQVFEEAEIGKTFKNDHKELKNLADPDAELPFEHLYLYMVQNVKVGPHEAAVKEVARAAIPVLVPTADGNGVEAGWARNYNRTEIEQIVVEGDLSAITKNNRKAILKDIEGNVEEGSVAPVEFWDWQEQNYSYDVVEDSVSEMTNAQVLLEYQSIMDMYNREVEMQRANRSLSYELLASEIFWNGDLGDSAGIDIVSDLDLVHFVLFGDYMELPDHSGEVVLASEILTQQDEAAAEWTMMREDYEDLSVVLAEESTEDFDPNTCYEDDALREEIENIEELVEILDENGVHPDTGTVMVVSSPLGDDDDDDGDDSTVGGEEEENNDEDIEELSNALKVAKGEWKRGLPCNERFCITVDLKTASWGTSSPEQGVVGAYDDRDNCVACHVAFVNEALQETMSKSMAPGKVSMNFFEDGTCKESGTLINLDMNVYAIGKPIVLDPGDDLMEKAMSELEDLETLLINARGLFRTNGTDLTGKTAEDIACTPYFNLQDIVDVSGVSLDEVLDECVSLSEEWSDMSEAVLEEHQFEVKALQNSSMYEIMSSRLYSMLIMIQEMQKGLEATYKTKQKPIAELQNTEYCD